MPTRLAAPVFTVDAGKMHKIDTTNVENLYSMWTVFNKCADSMEEGRRLENLSWRIWNRETLCCDTKPQFPASTIDFASISRANKDTPSLSSSVDSAISEDYEVNRSGNRSPVVEIKSLRSSKSSVESLSSSRLRNKHVSSHALEKMVISIKETKIMHKDDMVGLPLYITEAVHLPPLSPQASSSPVSTNSLERREPTPVQNVETAPLRFLGPRASHSSTSTAPRLSSPASDAASSNTSVSAASIVPETSGVVRGFTPSSISIHRNSSHLSPSPAAMQPRKSCLRPTTGDAGLKKSNFILGTSSEDDEPSSVEDRMSQNSKSPAIVLQKPHFDRKVTSFTEEVESRKISNLAPQDEDVFEDSEDEESDSDADDHDDDDDDDWEDSASESGAASPTDKAPLFQRVDSKPNLVSRRSMLTTMMHQSERANALAGVAAAKSQPNLQRSRNSTPLGPSIATSPEEESYLEMQRTDAGIPRSKPMTMAMASPGTNNHPALSPRTTRRNMLATELTESLRKHLLWERQQKNTTANAVLKRRHTAHDNMVNLQKYPGNNNAAGTNSKNNSWNYYFEHGLGEYHQKGW